MIRFAIGVLVIITAGGCMESAAVAKARAEAEAAKAALAKAEAELARPQAGAADMQQLNNRRANFGDAYNRQDAKAWASFYLDDADFVTEAGGRHTGPAAIEKLYSKLFADNPGMRVTAMPTNERFLAPGMLLEDGTWEVQGRKDGGDRSGRYVAVWVYRNGQWSVISHRAWIPTTARGRE